MKAKTIRRMLQGGKFFTITFIKKDGTIRVMNARLGVTKGLTGKGMTYDPIERNLLTVFDVQKQAYRMINSDTIQEIKFEGQTLKVQ